MMSDTLCIPDLIDMMTRQNWRASDPSTSREAGIAAQGFSHGDCADIHACMKLTKRPLAAEEIADLLGWDSHVRVNRRLKTICEAALIARTEEKHTNRSGRSAFRYRVI